VRGAAMSTSKDFDRLLIGYVTRELGSVSLSGSSDTECLNDEAIAQLLSVECVNDEAIARALAAETDNDATIAQLLAEERGAGAAGAAPPAADGATADDEMIARVLSEEWDAAAAGVRDLAADGAAGAPGDVRFQRCPACGDYVDLGNDTRCGRFIHFSFEGTPWCPHDVEGAAELKRAGRGFGCAAALVLEGGVLKLAE